MFFIDELENLKLYKRNFLLPLDEKDKRRNSISILMGTDLKSSAAIMNHPLLSPKYYISYYLERAVMYYINENKHIEMDQEIISESIEDVLDRNNKIIFKGYGHEIQSIQPYITKNKIDELSRDYGVKIKYPIVVNIVGRSGKRENTENQIWILPPSMYNHSLKNYEMYIYYNIIELILMNVNPDIKPEYKYAMALYDSGLATLHWKNWIFGSNLKYMCKRFREFEEENGHKALARQMGSNSDIMGIFKDYSTDFMKNKTYMKIFEADDITNNIDLTGMYQLNDTVLMGAPINEDSQYNAQLKRILFQDRFKNINELKKAYDTIKENVSYIRYTYNSIEMYKSLNLFVDVSHYMYSYIKNATVKKERGYNIFSDLMERLINDKRYTELGYTEKTVIIPIDHWIGKDTTTKKWLISEDINPISCIFKMAKTNPAKLKKIYNGTTFIFLADKGYFKVNFGTVDIAKFDNFFVRNIKILLDKKSVIEDDGNAKESSTRAITVDIVDKLERSQGIEVNNISTINNKPSTIKDKDKDKLVSTIAKAAETSSSEDDTLDKLDQDEELKRIIADLSAEADTKSNISDARASRMIKLQNDIMDKQFKDKSIRDLTSEKYDEKELGTKSIPVDSPNEEWKDLTFQTFEDVYDMDSDIIQILNQFSDKAYPLVVRDIKVEDTSTGENAVLTYTVQYETSEGNRFSIKFDLPKWIDNKYMILGGNKKDIPHQSFLMPISKTETDTVQIVTNYNKIFVRRFGTTTGKSFITCDRLIKTINKNEFKSLKVLRGDNIKICNRYELPIDYVDLACSFSRLETPTQTIYFNQADLREKYKDKIDEEAGIPVGVTSGGHVIYYNSLIDNKSVSFSQFLLLLLETDPHLSKEGFRDAYDKTTRSVRYTFSRASILNTEIPLVVMCAYSEGLTKTLSKSGIKYRIEKSKKSMDKDTEDFIKFEDAFIIYELDYASSLLLNGLKVCPTDMYSIAEMDNKFMYIDFLENFGGRIKADGLDNFYNLLIDKPITYNALLYYNLPTDYVSVLLYANRLLADNKFSKHTDYTDNRRIRRQEQIAAILYGDLAYAYSQYCGNMKHGKYVPMSMKQTAVIDDILKNSTTSDKSVINALGEYEAYASVTPKGPCGMNSDRSYTLDKRSFDSSMLNVMGMSTGFAGNVGINRQLTIDSNISTARGYVRNGVDNIDEISTTKTLCMTEAMTPFGSTRDDPFRTAMTFIQTSKHGIRCKRSNPNLITTGADEALPYMISNLFAFKAKKNGVVEDISDDRMLVKYDDGSYDYVNLQPKIEKNSSSGFYIILKLDTDLKVGDKIKKDQIIAYDKDSFSSDMGEGDNLAYNIGTMCKFAVLYTDEGFEDSAIVSEDLAEDMTSDIVLQVDKSFDKNTNIYNMVSVGQEIQEGDVLLVAQSAFEDEDLNTLMRNLTAEDKDDITDIGRIPIKSKVTGVVQDIKIFRTVEIEELSPTLQKIVKKYEKAIDDRKKEMKKYGIPDAELILGATGKLPATGRMKNVDGVKIEFYLMYEDKFSVGDKLIYYSANKGVAKDIFPRGKEPVSKFRPNEKIHALLCAGSIDGRMVCSILINGAINKGLIELGRTCKDMLGIEYNINLFEN